MAAKNITPKDWSVATSYDGYRYSAFAAGKPPPAITGLTATTLSASVIRLNWVDNSGGVVPSTVQQSANGTTGWTTIVLLAAGVTTYDVTALAASTVFYYRVLPAGIVASSSNVANARTLPAAPVLGAAPVLLSGTTYRVTIAFAAGATATREVSLNGGAYTSAGAALASGTTFFDYDVGSSTSFSFRSQANDGVSLSAYSNVSSGSTGVTWVVQSLQTGINNGVNFSDDKGGNGPNGLPNNAVWVPAAGTDPGFARVTLNNGGTSGLRWEFPDNTHKQVYWEVTMRPNYRPGYDPTPPSPHDVAYTNSKMFKLLGWGNVHGGNTSNVTIGPQLATYVGPPGAAAGVAYSDAPEGGDNLVSWYFTGVLGGGGSYTPGVPHPTFLTTINTLVDANWARWRIWIKYNDDGLANGEFAIWYRGVLVLHAINVVNCGVGLQKMGAIGLTEYTTPVSRASTTTGCQEDWSDLRIAYTRPPDLP